MKRIIAQARKELTQTFRDRLTLALALLLPLILLALLGTAIMWRHPPLASGSRVAGAIGSELADGQGRRAPKRGAPSAG